MPLRIEDERQPSRPTAPEPPKSKRSIPRGWAVVGTGAVVLLILVVVAGVRGQLSGPGGGTPPSAAGAPSSAEASPSPLSGRELAPGLVMGTASVEALNQDLLYGTRIGYPRTVDGAVAAAINYDAAWHTPAMFNKSQRTALNQRIYTDRSRSRLGMNDALAAAFAKQLGLNAQGQVLTEAGKVDSKRKLIAATYPRYGAYQQLGFQPSAEQPTEVSVTSWRPFVLGVGTDSDLSQVRLNWSEVTVTVVWDRNDWRIDESVTRLDTAKPGDGSVPNASYADRAAALGPGWTVPTDATESLLPGTVVP